MQTETKESTSSSQIQMANDIHRFLLQQTPKFRMVLSENVASLSIVNEALFYELLNKVRNFKDFNDDNDNYGEHDFGAIELSGTKYFWKFDYFDGPDYEWGFDRSSMGPDKCHRVLTIMEAREY